MGQSQQNAYDDDEGKVDRTVVVEDDGVLPISTPVTKSKARPCLIRLTGACAGLTHFLERSDALVGRAPNSDVRLDESGVSRNHARVLCADDGKFFVEDLGSTNGTFVRGKRLDPGVPAQLEMGDKLQIGTDAVLKFALFDQVEERYHAKLNQAIVETVPALDVHSNTQRHELYWQPDSWRSRPVEQDIPYDDPVELERVVKKLSKLPPLVTSWEVEELRQLIAEAEQGKRFLLQGGDCAETLDDCEPEILTNKLKIIIQMSLVLLRGLRRPVIRVGRFAGQYAKPRSKPMEKQNGVELPSYFGDLVNRPEFTARARRPDPERMLACYHHAALTLNFIRSVSSGTFADLRRPEYYDLSFSRGAELPAMLRGDYTKMCREITDGLQFLHALGDRASDELMKVKFFASHEGLNLHYEQAQTQRPPRRDRYYCLTTHLPWIGERTRSIDGAHVEFFRGIANPIGVKLGPSSTPEQVLELCRVLNPDNEPGKMVLVTRMGAKNVASRLPALVAAVRRSGMRALWVCDPMHGNGSVTPAGVKTRNFDDIIAELRETMEVHAHAGTFLGGAHFELTGDDVTECIGGGLTEKDLSTKYATLCDPRLNYRQALQMAFVLAEDLAATHAAR